MLAAGVVLSFLWPVFSMVTGRAVNNSSDTCLRLSGNQDVPGIINYGNVYIIIPSSQHTRKLEQFMTTALDQASKEKSVKSDNSVSKRPYKEEILHTKDYKYDMHHIYETEPNISRLDSNSFADGEEEEEDANNDIKAKIVGDSLVLPDGLRVSNKDVESMIRDIKSEPEHVLVYTKHGPPTSIVTFFGTLSRVEVSRHLEEATVVFANRKVVPLKGVISVLSFWRVLEVLSSNKGPIELSESETENVSTFFQYLASTWDIRLDCPKKKPFALYEKKVMELPVQSQNRLKLVVFGYYYIPYKQCKPFLYRKL